MAKIESRQFDTKRKAQAFAKQQFFKVLHDIGQSGDGPIGSREYWRHEYAPLNSFGWPSEYMTLSKVGKVWIADHSGAHAQTKEA